MIRFLLVFLSLAISATAHGTDLQTALEGLPKLSFGRNLRSRSAILLMCWIPRSLNNDA